jgi:DNA-binding IclR family transcriptional regulator
MTVPAAARVLDVIEVFSRRRRPMTISALAKALDLPASSCHGIVKTLEDRGYLVNHKDQGGYYFTKRLEQHANRIGGFSPLPSWVYPALEAMRDESDETALLARMSGGNAVYLEVLESGQSVRYIAQVGDLRPLYASAAGKALLGALPAQDREQLIDRMELRQRTPQTITSRKALERDLAASIKRGWFMTQGEFLPEVTAIALPVLLADDHYAIVIAGPSARMARGLEDHVKLLKALAHRAAAS